MRPCQEVWDYAQRLNETVDVLNAERDALRAEVEKLRAVLEAMKRFLCAEAAIDGIWADTPSDEDIRAWNKARATLDSAIAAATEEKP